MKKHDTCKSPRYFIGRWKMTLFCVYLDGEWVVAKRHGRGSVIFTFDDEKTVRERYRKFTKTPAYVDFAAEYGYCPEERLLWIDQSQYEPDGYLSICEGDRYRVEPINQDEVWLIVLNDVDNEPEDYRMKFKIMRDNSYKA